MHSRKSAKSIERKVPIITYDDRRETWNILWIFYCFGSFSQKAMEDMTWVISKGLVCFAKSFLEGTWSLRFLVLSQTLSPTFQGLKQEKVCSFMCCCANLWVALASFHAFSIWLSHCSRAGRKVFLRGGLDHGSYPMIRENRDLLVTECTAALWANSAMGRSSSHFWDCPL